MSEGHLSLIGGSLLLMGHCVTSTCVVAPQKGAGRQDERVGLSFRRRVQNLGLSAGVLGYLLLNSAVYADDTYDDDSEEERPEGLEDGEGDDSERVSEGLSAGGLAAPEAMPEKGDRRNEVEKSLDEADEKDAGRGLEFAYLNAALGYQNVGLTTLSTNTLLAESANSSAQGFMFSAGVGVRALYFTLGARFRRASMKEFGLWSLGAELGLKVPVGSWEPYGLLELGYAKVFDFQYSSLHSEATGKVEGMRGMSGRLAGGLDYYLSDSFSVGAQLSGGLLFLKRPAYEGESICAGEADCPYDEKGTGIGAMMTATALVGFHF